MTIRSALGWLGTLVFIAPLAADVVDTTTFEDVLSLSFRGDPANEVVFYDASVTEPYTLGSISWDGLATATEDPDGSNAGAYPTFGSELHVRVTHENSGTSTDIRLGNGMTFGPDPTQFTGTWHGLSGTLVDPGDFFSLEFYEEIDDSRVSPDAVWNTLSLNFHDDGPGEDIVRFDTTGFRSWETEPGEKGAEFYGIEYGTGGSGPSITNIRLEGHNFYSFWFDLRTDLGIEDGGQFRTNRLRGVEEPKPVFSDEDPSIDPDTGELLFADTFGTLDLEFEAGDFGPGDLIRFGVLTQTDDFFAETMGDQMSQLLGSGPLSVTVSFDDGTKVTAPLLDSGANLPKSSRVDLNVLDRTAPSGGDTDGDGDVDGDDLLDAVVGFGARFGALPSDGDVDGQGDVDDDDLTIIVASLGTGIQPHPAAFASGAAVPEPSGIVLLLLGMIAVSVFLMDAAPTSDSQ